jgi:putative acetyltransferase
VPPRKGHAAVTIRAYEPADADTVGRSLRGGPNAVIAGTLQIPWQSLDEQRARWNATDRSHTRTLVAEVDGVAVGMIGVHLGQRPRNRHIAAIGMHVDDALLGKGIGGALLDAAIELAEKWCGILRLELDVWVDNERAVRLYKSRGFEIEGVAAALALRDGELVDCYRMARLSKTMAWPRVKAPKPT